MTMANSVDDWRWRSATATRYGIHGISALVVDVGVVQQRLTCRARRVTQLLLHCALAAAQCMVIGPVCLWVCGCVCLVLGLLPR